MSTPDQRARFERELRYLVVKIKDANKYLTLAERDQLEQLSAKCALGRIDDGKRPLECICVESDWPEYEPTWKAIEARMTGAATPSAPQGLREALLHALPIGLDRVSQTDHDRILAALQPYVTAQPASVEAGKTAWTQTPPTEQDWYWHWNGDDDSAPLPTSVMWSGTTGKCFVTMGQLGLDHAVDCDQYGGWWRKMATPKTPTQIDLDAIRPPPAQAGTGTPTPETDAEETIRFCIHENKNLSFVPSDFARRLEQQRDAARGEVEALKENQTRLTSLIEQQSKSLGIIKTSECALRSSAELLAGALEVVSSVMSESKGVAGYHSNGDILTWDEGDPALRPTVDSALTAFRSSVPAQPDQQKKETAP